MTESQNRYLINHPDGASTIFAPDSQNDDARENNQQIISGEKLLEVIKKFPLPFRPQAMEIIGYGGYSVAMRITIQNGNSFVGVLRYQDTELPDNPTNDLIRSSFEDYSLEEWSIVLGDNEGKKLSLKFVPEIEGATLKDISVLHLLGNKKLLAQFADFCSQAFSLFKSKGVLPDLVGHNQKGLSFFPFLTNNLMFEFGTNELKLVDTDLMPNNIFNEVSKIRQFILLLRASSVYFSGLLAQLFVTLLEKGSDLNNLVENDPNFVNGISDVISTLDQHNVDYRVLGSVAIAGYLEEEGVPYPLSARRKGGSRRDIDVLVLNKTLEEIKELEKIFASKQENDDSYPEVSFSSPVLSTHNPDTVFHRLLPRITSKFSTRDTGELVQRHGSLKMEIPESDLERKKVTYQGVTFDSIDPNALLGLVITRNGVIKFKDLEKFELFFKHVDAKIPHRYLDFARSIRSTHRKEFKNFMGRQWLSLITRGIFDGSFTRKSKQ